MATFYDLSETAQILFMAAQFIATCMGICMVPMVYQKRRWLPKLILPIGFLISGGMLAIFSANIRVQKQNLPMPAVTKWASELPIWISILLLVAIFGYMVFLLVRERLYRKSTITRFSIKEGLDSLSSGLCFYEPSGRIILSNNCMQELCHKLVGRDLQNAALFWQLLQQGETNHVRKKPGVSLNGVCLRQGDTPAYRLPDGTVWSFAMKQLGSICQLTAADTTQIHELTTRLEQENQQLEQFNQRLRDYGEKADALTRAKERLEIKVKVHGMLGQALLATRRCLQDEGISTDEAMSLWHHSVAVLHKEAVQETEKPLEALKKAAAATGITLELKGEIPEETKVRQLFLQAAAESLTNAISHAKAKTLYVDFAEDPYAYRVTIYNDGLLPTGPVREGGGLSALRKNVERIGGQLEIKSVPQFILTVTIGKGGDRDVKILLVEDDPMARQLLEIYVQSSGRYDLVDSLESALFAEAYCTANCVDAVLMDVCTAMNASGLDAAESIKKHLPHVKIVIITSQPECSFIDRAKAVGVDSFWYKSATAEEILNVLDRTMAGESVFPESTPVLHIGNADSSEFTDRELEVLRLVVAGETDAAIAEKLYMSLRTVKHHIQSMKDKTGFRNRTELAVRARAKGLIINKLQSSE